MSTTRIQCPHCHIEFAVPRVVREGNDPLDSLLWSDCPQCMCLLNIGTRTKDSDVYFKQALWKQTYTPRDRALVEQLMSDVDCVTLRGRNFTRQDPSWVFAKCESFTHLQFIEVVSRAFVCGNSVGLSRSDSEVNLSYRDLEHYKTTDQLLEKIITSPTYDWISTLDSLDEQLKSVRTQYVFTKNPCLQLVAKLEVLRNFIAIQMEKNPDFYLKMVAPFEADQMNRRTGGVIDLRKSRFSI